MKNLKNGSLGILSKGHYFYKRSSDGKKHQMNRAIRFEVHQPANRWYMGTWNLEAKERKFQEERRKESEYVTDE